MRSIKRWIPLLALALTPWLAQADDTNTLEQQAAEMERLSAGSPERAEQRVAKDFARLAGSADNAEVLVSALREGDDAVLVWTDAAGKPVSTEIDPQTGSMGLGNVFISLALAQESLRQAGIAKPTPEQLEAALNGGEVRVGDKTIVLGGVLAQRANGSGWGQIAQSLGVKLGPVVSAIRSENGRLRADARRAEAKRAEGAAAKGAGKDTGRREVVAAKAERPAKADRPERPGRPDQPGKPERTPPR